MININNIARLKILLATTNKGKQRELRSLLAGYPINCVTPDEIGMDLVVEENGSTYAENASIKARAYCDASGMAVLSDDTGLEVDALGGAPGLHSARFSTIVGATDADRRQKLLSVLAGFPRPWTAHFACVVVVAFPQQPLQLFEGAVYGEIIEEERGNHGFGYDRLFYIPPAGRTLAELDLEDKNAFSHRAIAVKKAIPYLINFVKE